MISTAPVRRRVRGLYFGWALVGIGMVMQAMTNALLGSSFGAYVVLLQGDFGWSKTIFSLGYSMQQVESGLLGPLQGWMLDRFGPRAVMRVGIVLFGLGFIAFSRINSMPTFFLAFLVIALGSSLGGYFPATYAIVNWFERRRATAMGIMQTGMGIGGVLAPLVAWSLAINGWRATAVVSGILIITIGLPAVQYMRRRPEDYGLLPDGDAPATHAPRQAGAMVPPARRARDFTLREAMRTRAFWFVSFGHASALLVVSAVMVHLQSHLKESLGYSVEQSALAVALMTVMTTVGQVCGGILGDRISKRLIAGICMVMHGIGLIVVAYATGFWMVAAFAVLHGIAWGARGPLMQAIRADYFGRSSYGAIMGTSSLVVTAGTVAGPVVAGVMADRFGSYHIGFTVLAVLAALGCAFWVFAGRPAPPRRASEALPA